MIGEKRGRISPEQTQAFLGEMLALHAIVDYASLEQVCGPVQAICRNHRLTPYDALYIEPAMRSRCPLATLDHFQQEAAEALDVQCL